MHLEVQRVSLVLLSLCSLTRFSLLFSQSDLHSYWILLGPYFDPFMTKKQKKIKFALLQKISFFFVAKAKVIRPSQDAFSLHWSFLFPALAGYWEENLRCLLLPKKRAFFSLSSLKIGALRLVEVALKMESIKLFPDTKFPHSSSFSLFLL